MQLPGSARFSVRGVSPTRMVKLFMSRHGLHSTAASASGAAATPAAPAAPAADLVTWVESSGGSITGVAVRRDEAGFGLQAASDVSAGSTLISLPPRCHLTYDGSTDARLLTLIDQVPAELWGAKLALQVVAHRLEGATSHFAPYINNLPLGVAGLPMFFNGDALGALQYPPVTEQVKRRCRWLLSFSQQALAPIRGSEADPFGGAEVDANALGWALAVVTSRAFRTRGPSQPAAMLPLIDMANHSFEPNAKIAPGPGGSMCMVATRQLVAGEPVLISYGQLGNDFLLLDYGFVMPTNPYDTVQLRFDRGLIEAAKAVAGVGSSDNGTDSTSDELPPLPAWQQQALASLQLAGPGANTEVTIRRQGPGQASSSSSSSSSSKSAGGGGFPVDPRLLAGVRVLCAPNAAALGGKAVSVEQLGRWDAPLASMPAELAALRTLTGLCAIALSQFKGTVDDDAALLAGTPAAAAAAAEAAEGVAGTSSETEQQQLTEDQQLAVQFRMDKKRLLLEALAAISQRIKQLAASASPGGRQQAANGGGGGRGKGAKNGGRGFG